MPSGGGTPGAGTPSGGSPGAEMPSGGGMPGGGMPDGGDSGSSGSAGSAGSAGDSSGGGSAGSSGGGSGDSGSGVGGVESIAGVPMPGGVGEFPGEGSGSGDAEALEKELDKSIGDFDEVLMEEQQQVQSVGRNTEGFDGTGGRGSDAGISLGEQAEGGMGSGGGSGGAPMAGQNAPKPVASTMSEEEIAARTPDDIEVIIDSDIVAKQLREAALAEDDPELRERLWEEYRKYNGLD